jgi:hypothetical protein
MGGLARVALPQDLNQTSVAPSFRETPSGPGHSVGTNTATTTTTTTTTTIPTTTTTPDNSRGRPDRRQQDRRSIERLPSVLEGLSGVQQSDSGGNSIAAPLISQSSSSSNQSNSMDPGTTDGGPEDARQRSHYSSASEQSGILLKSISNSQTGEDGEEIHLRYSSVEPALRGGTREDGEVSGCISPHPTRGLPDVSGHQRSLSPCPNPHPTSEISSVRNKEEQRGSFIPIPGPTDGLVICPFNLHQDDEAPNPNDPGTRDPLRDLHGRPPDHVQLQGEVNSGHEASDPDPAISGPDREHEEVGVGTIPNPEVSGNGIEHIEDGGHSPKDQTEILQGSNPEDPPASPPRDIDRPSPVISDRKAECSPSSHRGSPNVYNLHPTAKSPCGPNKGMGRSRSSPPRIVGGNNVLEGKSGYISDDRKVVAAPSEPYHHRLRRVGYRLWSGYSTGCSLPSSTSSARKLGRGGSRKTHQLERAVDSSNSSDPLWEDVSMDEHDNQVDDRQHSGDDLPQQTGRQDKSTQSPDKGSSFLLLHQSSPDSSDLHSGNSEHHRRPAVSSNSKELFGMATQSKDIPEDTKDMVSNDNRSVRERGEQAIRQVCDAATNTDSLCNRCFSHLLVDPWGAHVCQSSLLPPPSNLTENAGRQSNSNNSSTIVAHSSLVANPPVDGNRSSSSNSSGSITTHTGSSSPSSSSTGLADSRLAMLIQSLRTKGLAEPVLRFLLQQGSESTSKNYDSAWRRFVHFVGNSNQSSSPDSFINEMRNQIVSFIHKRYEEGAEQGTINQVVSCVCQMLHLTHGINLANDPVVLKAKEVLAVKRPRNVKYEAIYDIDILLRMIHSWGNNSKLSIHNLRAKVILLLKIDTMCRSDDLAKVHRHSSSFILNKDTIQIRFYKSKEVKQAYWSPWITVHAYKPDPIICTVTAVKRYLQVTKKQECGDREIVVEKKRIQSCGLLVGNNKIPSSLTPQRIATITKEYLGKAKIPDSFTGHSTRSASITKAATLGVPKQRIMEVARISSDQVYAKHYLRLQAGNAPSAVDMLQPMSYILRSSFNIPNQ